LTPIKIGAVVFSAALLFGCTNLPKANLDDHENIIAEYAVNNGERIVTGAGFGYQAFGGSQVIAMRGSDVTAYARSNVVACSGSSVTALDGSRVYAAADAKIDARDHAFIVVGDVVHDCQRLHPQASAYGGVTAGAGTKVFAYKGAIVHALAGSTVYAYAGSSVQAEPGSDVHAFKGSDVYHNEPAQDEPTDDASN